MKRIPGNKRFFLGILVAWFLLHSVYTTYDGLHAFKGNADVAIILGNVVNADSSLSPWLRGRVDKAFELYRERRVKKIFASGGEGESHIKEGDAMKKYLLERGMNDSDLVVDNNGENTYLTARDFLALNAKMHFSSAIVVSSFYHITRSKYIIRKLGFKNVHGVSSDDYFPEDLYGLFREFFAFYKYVLFY